MIFFQRLFASYYLILISLRRSRILRRLNRGGTEDLGAMCLVVCVQFYFLCILIFVLKRFIGFKIPTFTHGLNVFQTILLILIIGSWIYFNNKYFLSNRQKRNKFIDSFIKVSKIKKVYWNAVALFLMFTPVWFLIYIILRK